MEPNSDPNPSSQSENLPPEPSHTQSTLPSSATPKNSSSPDSPTRQKIIGSSDELAKQQTKYFIVNPYNSPVGNPPTPEKSYSVDPPNPVSVNVQSAEDNSSISESITNPPKDNASPADIEMYAPLKATPSQNQLTTPDNVENPSNLPVSNPVVAESPVENPSTTPAANSPGGRYPTANPGNPPTYNTPPLITYFPNAPPPVGPQRGGNTGNSPNQNPDDVPLPNTVSRLSLAYVPVSYRSSVFSLAITKFIFAPFIIFLFFISHVHGKKPLSLHLSWMLGLMLVLELLHGSILTYGVLQKKLSVIRFCIWYTLFMGSYTSSVGIVGVMVFIGLAQYTMQFFMVFVFLVLICNIFTVLCCDVPLLVCYKQELLGQSLENTYPGTFVNVMFGRI